MAVLPDTLSVKSDHFDDAEQKSIVKVPVRNLPGSEGVIAKEVVAPDGTVMLPAGVDITLFDASLGAMIDKMESYCITHVFLHAPQQLTDDDLDKIIEKIYSEEDSPISKEKARDVVKKVDTLFRSAASDDVNPEIVRGLASMGHDLTEDILRNPSVAFSLGKVRDADEYTFVHSFNVAVLSGFLASRLYPGNKDFMEKIIFGALLHDMGKAKIRPEVLNKPGPLDKDELMEMNRHPTLGVSLALKAGVNDAEILAIIGGHHEKWSGKGYPKKRKGLEIPETARIAAVADVFDALTAKRVYKNPMSSRNAITIILKDSGSHFDSKIARELLTSLGLYPPGSIVALSDGRIGIVVSGGGKDLVRPVVILKNNSKNPDAPPAFIDLKTSGDLCIAQYLGHGDKREIGY